MVHYLIDASVAADFYRPEKSFSSEADYSHQRLLEEHVTKQRLSGQAVIFIPAFCVPEVLNTLARWWFREKTVFDSRKGYNLARKTFITHVHDRKFFYSYDLTRYHNINCEEVFRIEHRTKVSKRGQKRGHMSALDILVIGMGMELKRICGNEIHLLTKDYRQAEIANKRPGAFPRAYYWPDTTPSDLPHE